MTTSAAKNTVVLMTTGLSHTAGGPFFSVSGLASALQSATDWRSHVIGSYGDVASWPNDRCQWTNCELIARPHAGLSSASALASACLAVLDAASGRGDTALMHVSGLWDAASIAGALVAGRWPGRYVVSPRGMLEPWALRTKAVKKQAALLLWQHKLLAGATLLHATSHQECESIRSAGFRNPVCVVPNGVAIPGDAQPLSPAARSGGSRRCVFLSRIHPKKGLPLLIKAWALVRPVGWTLEIAGYAEDRAHEADIRRLVNELGLTSVAFVGERQGREKWDFLRGADLFVLPSYSENFGIVVAEALASGVPVIATTGTPWRVLAERGLGWWVDPSEPALASALAEAVAEPPDALARRCAHGREYALQQFGWDQLATRMAAAYAWAVGNGPPTPDIVFG